MIDLEMMETSVACLKLRRNVVTRVLIDIDQARLLHARLERCARRDQQQERERVCPQLSPHIRWFADPKQEWRDEVHGNFSDHAM